MLTDVAGADNAASRALGSASDALTELESPYRKAQKQERAAKIQDAEATGSTWEEVKAHVGSFADAPLDTTLNALGTSVPTIAAGMLTGGGSAAAQIAARAAPVVLGVAQGVGNVKGQIHETVKQKHMAAGMPEAEATQRADAAQAYGGDNTGSIAVGGALGGLAGGTGVESSVRNLMGRKVASEAAERAAPGVIRSAVGGVLKEAPMEAAQGGQERLASNTALQGEGFDVPTWQGVAGQAALEGIAAAPMGGGFGAVEGLGAHAQPARQKVDQTAATSAQPEAEPASAAPPLALPAPVINVAPDGTAITAADRNARLSRIASGDVTDVTPIPAADPVREAVAAAAEQGGALSGAALTAIDSGAVQVVQPEQPTNEPRAISLEEADARDQAAYEQFFASLDTDPVVSRYFEDDTDIPDFGAASNVSDEEFLRSLGATDEDIQDAIATASQPAIPQSRPAVDAGAQANESAGSRQGAGADQASQGQVAAAPAPAPSAPTNLRDGLARVRAQKQEAANAKAAAPKAAPATAPISTAGPAAVEAAGVERSKLLASLDQTGATREMVLDAQLKDAQDRLAQMTAATGILPADRASRLSGINQEISDLKAVRAQARELDERDRREGNTRSMLQGARQELDAAVRAGTIAPEAAQAVASNAKKTGNAADASEAIFVAVDTSTTGATSEPQATQAIQASAQPAQAAAPAAEPTTGGTSTPAAAGAPEVRALTDGTPAQNLGAQTAAAPGAKAAAPAGQKKALDRVNAGKAYYFSQAKAQAFVSDNALGDTHEVVQDKKRFVVRAKPAAEEASDVQQFAPETGTLGIPRAEMPQVPAQSHGGLVKHLNAQGIEHETTMVDAAELKPTQAEFSPSKVEQAKEATGDRAVIVSNDGHIIDGHHQALAAAEDGKPVKAIVLDAPVEQALDAVKNSPSAQKDGVNQAPALDGQSQVASNNVAESAESPSDRITDFGEKIGGARKDQAGTKSVKAARQRSADERPAWARRYEVSQIAKSIRVGEEGRWVVRDSRRLDAFKQPRQMGRETYATKEEAEQAVPMLAVSQKHRVVPVRGDGAGYEIWRDVSDRKRVKVVDQVFPTREAALEYMVGHAQAIIETNTTFGEADLPRPPSDQRLGAERRTGDARDSDFMAVFGFRGVEFGNWNNQQERQELLNDAYDGLLDLAEVMDVPPRAISLNGELALAFGARGHGLSGARAHYELDKVVINLTKMNGAGSLAHEWFHALDHYFGRQDGKAPAEWVVAKDGTRSLRVHDAPEDDMASGGTRGERSGMRPELREVFADVMRTIARKAEAYVEDTARADRFVAAAREEVKRRLDGIRADLARDLDTRYYKRHNKAATAEQLAEFDSVAEKIVAGELLELRVESKGAGRSITSGVRWTNDALNRLSTVMKAVRGRQGFSATQDGPLDRLRGLMQNYSARLKILADAQATSEKSRMVPTEFIMNAKELDQGRGQDYWTRPHELAARAFQGYVEDKIAERGGRSPFLNYGPENVGIPTPWGFKRPFPAGAERAAINKSLDKLVEVIQTREGDDGGVVLFSRTPETQASYESRIEALFSGDKPRMKGARVLDRSDMVTFLGLGDGPVNLAEGKVIAGQSNHPHMTAAVWKQIPEWLENPAMVFDSDTAPGRLVFIAPELVNGSPVRIVVEPNAAGGVNAHLLVNAYDAQSNAFRRWESAGLLRYVDRNKYAHVSGTFQPQLTGLPGDRGRNRILTDKQYNGYRRANTPAAFQGPAPEPTKLSNARLVATQMLVDELKANWTRSPEIIVARNMQDMQIPQLVRDYDAQLKSQGSDGEARGFIYKGKVYLLADQLNGPAQIAEVLFHEVLGHYGLRGSFGDGLTPVLQQIGTMRRAEVLAKAREYGMVQKGLSDSDTWAAMSARDRLSAAEEVLAEMAQSTPEIGFVQRAIAAIRTWLRANVPGFKALALTDDEIVRSYILPARGYVTRSDETPQQSLQRALLAFDRDGQGDAPMFSRASMASALDSAGQAIKSVTVTNIKERAGFKMTDYLGVGLQALGRRQIVDIYGDMLPMAEYNRLVQQMEADKNEGGAEADQLVTRWAKLSDEGKLANLMHDATLAQIDPAKPYEEGDDKAKYTMLRGQFDALTDAAKQVYTDTRDSYQAHHAKVRSAIKERIERSELKGERKRALLEQMDGEFFKAVKGVYFPLARFGQYAVTVKGPDGKVESVSRAETKAEAEALRSSLLSAFPRDKGFTVGRVMLSKDFIADRDAVGRGFMTELYQVLDKQDMDATQRAELEDTLGQLYLSSLPDLSWAKHGIHRKGTPGFSQDARRAFAQNMFHGARYLAKLRYSDLMQDELSAMQKHVDDWREVPDFDQNTAQRVVDELNKRHESLMNPKSSPLATALTSFGFIFHLGLSPASALVNLSQTALVAYPIMGAKWGFGKASAALLKASQQAAKGKNDITGALNAEERAAYDEAVRAGTIDVTMAHDLAGIAQGEDAGVMWKIRPVMRWASFLFHHAERFNRQVTFVAAYRLARESGADQKLAFEQATKATYDGHFDYGAANRPRIMQGNVAKVLLLFKQYGQNMVYTLARNAQQAIKAETPEARAQARKALGGLLATHAAAAGVLGLPMVTTLLAAASMVGGDDDEPWDAKVALQNMLADTFGQKTAEVLAHGLSRLTPWDISGRVGLDKLIFPDVQEGLEGQRLAESAMAAALGPVAGIGVNLLKGMQMMSEGRYAMGLEAMMPAALRGPVKSIRYANEGVQDKSGISILDEVSPAAVAGQFLGFSPSEARNAQEGKSAIMALDRALGERRQELLTKIAKATMAKDEEAKVEAREEIKRFNEKNPGRRINPNHIMASVRNRQKRIDQAQDGVYLPRNRRDAMDAGRFAVSD